MTESGIYQIRNINNNKVYIGSAVNLERRKKEHFGRLNKGIHCNSKLQSAFNKYGIDNFVFEVIEQVDNKEELISREQFYIDSLNAVNEGYNLCPIAGSSLGTTHSKESKDKMSKSHKGIGRGIPKSEEHRKKLSQSVSESIKGENNPFYGKHHTNETKERISKKLSGENHHFYGKHFSEEHKRKLSLANKGKHSKNKDMVSKDQDSKITL